jgi:hypothetical protein
VAGRHHRHAGNVESELREVGDRREREANVEHLHSSLHEAQCQCLFDGERVRAEVMPDDNLAFDAQLADQRAKPQAQRLHAEQVQLRRLVRTCNPEPHARHIRESRWASPAAATRTRLYWARGLRAAQAAWVNFQGREGAGCLGEKPEKFNARLWFIGAKRWKYA